MSLLVTNNRNAAAYLQLNKWTDAGPRVEQSFLNGAVDASGATYIDRFDRVLSHTTAVSPNEAKPAQWDPNLIDSTSASVGPFNSPISNGANTPWFVSDYEPATTSQRLFHVLSQNEFQELNIADPTAIIDSDPFPLITRLQSDATEFDFAAQETFAWAGTFNQASSFVFFPDIDLAIAMNARVIVDPTPGVVKSNVIVAITLSTASGAPLGVPGHYSATSNEFGRPAIFDETSVEFKGIQFIADDQSTHSQPKGELLLFSGVSAPVTANDGRLYIKFVDFNPSGVSGTPNRVHLRETLFSRINLLLNTTPTGDPGVPINALPLAVAALQHPNVFYTSEGSRRVNVMGSDLPAGDGDSIIVSSSKAVVAGIVTPPAPKQDPVTNRTSSYQSDVLGDLGESVGNVVVDWTALRQSTVSEILLTTPTPGETVTVDNVPIDRGIEFTPGFAVLEDGIALVEGGGNDYTVNEALGQITFISPKPLGAGEVYTIRYAHTAAPASPSHGTIVDAQVFSDINGVAETRMSWPDDATLVGHIDEIKATTP